MEKHSSHSSELQSVHALYDRRDELERALTEDRWSPKRKQQITDELKDLEKLLREAEKNRLHEDVMGGPEVMQHIELVRKQAELRLAGDKNWKNLPGPDIQSEDSDYYRQNAA